LEELFKKNILKNKRKRGGSRKRGEQNIQDITHRLVYIVANKFLVVGEVLDIHISRGEESNALPSFSFKKMKQDGVGLVFLILYFFPNRSLKFGKFMLIVPKVHVFAVKT
jgi:hypothetical protein